MSRGWRDSQDPPFHLRPGGMCGGHAGGSPFQKHSLVPLEGRPNYCDRAGLEGKTRGEGKCLLFSVLPSALFELVTMCRHYLKTQLNSIEKAQKPVCQPQVCRLHTLARVRLLSLQP